MSEYGCKGPMWPTILFWGSVSSKESHRRNLRKTGCNVILWSSARQRMSKCLFLPVTGSDCVLSLWNGYLQRYKTSFFPFRSIAVCLLPRQTKSRSRRSLSLWNLILPGYFPIAVANLNPLHSNHFTQHAVLFPATTQLSLSDTCLGLVSLQGSVP